MQSIGKRLLTKLVECILQSRVKVEKKQIRHFDDINRQIINHKYAGQIQSVYSMQQFLNSLLLADKFPITNNIRLQDGHQTIAIQFHLRNIDTGQLVLAEAWLIQFEEYGSIEQEDTQQVEIVVTLFEQLIIFLNKQPLFSEYQRNHKMKTNYAIEYQINIDSKGEKDQKEGLSILSLCHKHTKERVCQSFLIRIECYYLNSLLETINSWESLENKEKEKEKKEKTIQPKSKDEEDQISTASRTRKVSVYEFYDKELDFVFLSSDDETFKKSPKSEVKEINIAEMMDDDEFQLLVVSIDEQFLDDNKDLLAELGEDEMNYFTF